MTQLQNCLIQPQLKESLVKVWMNSCTQNTNAAVYLFFEMSVHILRDEESKSWSEFFGSVRYFDF